MIEISHTFINQDKMAQMLSLDSESIEVIQCSTSQSIPDDQQQIAAKARLEFQQTNYSSCLQTLKKLHVLRPDDAKVFHNMCIVEYYLSNCCDTATFYNNLLTICKTAHIDEEFDLIDDVDQSVVFYNKAVIFYHLQKYEAALELLDKVFQYVEPLEEFLALKICFLLIEIYIVLNQPKKALSVASFVENTNFSGPNKGNSCSSKTVKDTNDNTKAKLVQYRARCYMMMKSFKPCKREVKTLMTLRTQDQQIAGLFIKSRLEFFRSNYKKALRIITSAQYPKNTWDYFLETGDSLKILSLNNLACIHHVIGKGALAAHYLYAAIELLKTEQNSLKIADKSFPSNQSIHTLRSDLLYKLVLNLGLVHFRNKNYKAAFDSFVQATQLFTGDSLLWLRIAECCIYSCKTNEVPLSDMVIVKRFIGTGVHKKAILNSSPESFFNCVSKTSPIVGLTLEYATHALKVAWHYLPKETEIMDNKNAHSLLTNIPPSEDQEPLSTRISHFIITREEEMQKLRNHILSNCSYVALRTGDAFAAYACAMKLLAEPQVSGFHQFLAHSYAAEALMLLDKISEAIDHVNPDLITDASNAYIEESPSKQNKLNSKPNLPTLEYIKAVAQYNLALVYTVRGEWARACSTLSKINPESLVPAKDLKAYIDLCQGATDVAKSYLNECFATDPC